jgi:hypothetical protein
MTSTARNGIKQHADSSQELRADVFISHSRKDKEFVHRLAEMLEESDRKAWVDVESITPTGSLLLMDIEVEPLSRIHLLKQRF